LIVVDPRAEADGTRGTVVEAFTESVDVLPTLCTWMGTEVPLGADGRELQPFLHDGTTPDGWRTEAHWQWDFRDPVDHVAEDVFGITMEQCSLDVVRAADHKYVHLGNGDCFFFDLTDDPDQLVDRSADPDRAPAVADARGHLLEWRMRHDDRTLTGTVVTAKHGLVVRRDPRR
jgi:arylsulfatase A-like enzyme